jgi:hypothetical protein
MEPRRKHTKERSWRPARSREPRGDTRKQEVVWVGLWAWMRCTGPTSPPKAPNPKLIRSSGAHKLTTLHNEHVLHDEAPRPCPRHGMWCLCSPAHIQCMFCVLLNATWVFALLEPMYPKAAQILSAWYLAFLGSPCDGREGMQIQRRDHIQLWQHRHYWRRSRKQAPLSATTDDPKPQPTTPHRQLSGSGAAAERQPSGSRAAAERQRGSSGAAAGLQQISLHQPIVDSDLSKASSRRSSWSCGLTHGAAPGWACNRENMGERRTDAERPRPTASHD